MTRATLLHVLDRPTALGPAEVRELEQLALAFPYCQTAHLLLAKAAHDQGTMLASQRLRRAATYAADRTLLRRLIEQVEPLEVEVAEMVVAQPDTTAAAPTNVIATPTAEEPAAAPPVVTELPTPIPAPAAATPAPEPVAPAVPPTPVPVAIVPTEAPVVPVALTVQPESEPLAAPASAVVLPAPALVAAVPVAPPQPAPTLVETPATYRSRKPKPQQQKL